MTGRIFQLNRSSGGVPKHPIAEVEIGVLGLEGDGHAHPKHHGGPDRAVSLFALEVIQALQAEGEGEHLHNAGVEAMIRTERGDGEP